MAAKFGFDKGALQPDGRYLQEPLIDGKHVADTIVHIANLPLDVAMLAVNIMYVGYRVKWKSGVAKLNRTTGRQVLPLLGEGRIRERGQ